MAEVTKLIKELSKKFDTLQEDVNNLKKRGGKHKKKKSKRSRRRDHSKSWSRSRSRSRSMPWRSPTREEGSLGETRLCVAEAAHLVLGEEHVRNLMTGGRLPVLQQ